MSSFTRRIQRSQQHLVPVNIGTHHKPKWVKRKTPGRRKPYMGRGSMLGHTNPKAKDLLARKAREAARINNKGN